VQLMLQEKIPRPLMGHRNASFEFVLPAPQDRVGQDTRTEQQRSRGQRESRPSAWGKRARTGGGGSFDRTGLS
jgi:hypothetical protein